jgi:hypothetical protein
MSASNATGKEALQASTSSLTRESIVLLMFLDSDFLRTHDGLIQNKKQDISITRIEHENDFYETAQPSLL